MQIRPHDIFALTGRNTCIELFHDERAYGRFEQALIREILIDSLFPIRNILTVGTRLIAAKQFQLLDLHFQVAFQWEFENASAPALPVFTNRAEADCRIINSAP